MIALRSIEGEEFGTVEADLMKSTAMILAVHLINQRQYDEMQQMFEGTIQSLVSALDAKDAYTCGHSTRVAELAVELAQRLEYCEDGVARIRMAGILHDIGKIGVDDSVLRKPGKLTDEEFEQIKQHPVLGYEILRGIRPFRKILPAVRHHHESWDGSGYPDGLAGEAIPRDAQVLAVADAFDAMTSDRPYRNGMPIEKVMGIFEGGRGTQWAADVVDVLLSCPDVMQAYTNQEGSDVQDQDLQSDE
jgi:putative nucleotidyltransferase with HDIG domain